MTELPLAPEILCSTPGSFAWDVHHLRHPALIKQVRDTFPYGPDECRRLDELLHEITEGVIERLDPEAHDFDTWNAWGRDYFGKPWREAPFLWVESYFYRKLLSAVRYFEFGPQRGIDPFEPEKTAALYNLAATDLLVAFNTLPELSTADRDAAALQTSLRGNRGDLAFNVGSPGKQLRYGDPQLVADDSDKLWRLLEAGPPGAVHVIGDNAGYELMSDLFLIDHLLTTGRASVAVLHVKPYPYFVSDSMPADVFAALRRLCHASDEAGKAGARLWAAMESGRLAVRAHPFMCAPYPYRDMPLDLRKDFATASVAIFKGEVNYRRLVGDFRWPASTPFADVTEYFPAPVVALRVMKSELAVGIDDAVVTDLGLSGAWRSSGTHALIHASHGGVSSPAAEMVATS
jgi:hypothetical protein